MIHGRSAASPLPVEDGVAHAAADLQRALAAGAPLVFTAGAGMGVDSGLPDFRGPQGFWRAYPAYEHLGLRFEDLADPRWFHADPSLAWGFYGHRRNLYRDTLPHGGYDVLRAWAAQAVDAFVFTSNVDGAFDRAGFADGRVAEVHGAIEWMQCTADDHGVWPAGAERIDVDAVTFRARPPFPACPRCGALARPNILMFGDRRFDDTRCGAQLDRLEAFLVAIDPAAPMLVVECGAGTAIPTVRGFGEGLLRRFPRATLVRVNLREPQVDDDVVADRVVGIAAGAHAALRAIADRC
jgi:NAD-dependent SIR2 family protein deacetylase